MIDKTKYVWKSNLESISLPTSATGLCDEIKRAEEHLLASGCVKLSVVLDFSEWSDEKVLCFSGYRPKTEKELEGEVLNSLALVQREKELLRTLKAKYPEDV